MTRKSKRELEREVKNLESDDTADAPLVFGMTTLGPPGEADREDSPHPELTVEQWPDSPRHDTLGIAIPNLIPYPYAEESMLFVESCGNRITETWPDDPEDTDTRVRACDLWDALTEEDLGREYKLRIENDEPVPPVLERYAPE